MGRAHALWWGTVQGAGLVDLAEAAAGAGFADISITPTMYDEARAEGHSDAAIRSRLADLRQG